MVVAGASRRGGSVVVPVPSAGIGRPGMVDRPGVVPVGSGMTGTSTVGMVAAGVSSDASGRVRASIVGCGSPRGADGRAVGIVAVGAGCAGTRTRAPSPASGGSWLAGRELAGRAGRWARLRREWNRRKDSIVRAVVDMLLSP
jgi:hypothetical protein